MSGIGPRDVPYRDACQRIQQAIVQFEAETGRQVHNVSLQNIEVTRAVDEKQRWVRVVQIKFEPAPGETVWA